VSGSAKKSEAEAVLHRAVNDALHLLSLLRLVLPASLHPCSCSSCLLCSCRKEPCMAHIVDEQTSYTVTRAYV
jgi:hypothetical protein